MKACVADFDRASGMPEPRRRETTTKIIFAPTSFQCLCAVTIMAPERSPLKGDTTSRRSPIERKSTHGSGANQTTVSRSRATQQVASALLEPARAPRRICGSGKRRPVSDSEGGIAERWIAVDSQGKQRNLDAGADQRQPVYHHVPSAHGLRGTQHPAQLLRRG